MICRKPLLTLCAALLLVPGFIGCQGETGGPASVEAVPAGTAPGAKEMLNQYAQSGEPVGSAGMQLQAELEKVKQSDPAKGDALLKDFDELKTMTDPAKIKAKAAEMAGKL